jgi:hypothetical protein
VRDMSVVSAHEKKVVFAKARGHALSSSETAR